MDKALSGPPYDLALQDRPFLRPREGYLKTIEEDFHWHLEILPQVIGLTGFERASWFFYNPVPPELAARACLVDKARCSIRVISPGTSDLCGNPATLVGSRSIDRDATQKCEVLEKLCCAQHHTAQGIVGNAHRQTGFFPDPLV